MIKDLILLKIQKMMVINVDLNSLFLIKNYPKNYKNQFLKNLRKEKYAHFYRQCLGHRFSRYKIKFDKRFTFLLCAVDIYNKDAWVVF